MARKRGGLAGIYDRNKTLIKTVAPIAAGFIPGVGPLVGAALGAALGGDKEGKGYFSGFDVGGAVKGGLSGYGGAKLGQAAKGGLGQLFTGGASPIDKLTGAPKLGALTQTTSGAAPVLPGAGAAGAAGGVGGAAAGSAGSAAGSAGSVYGNIPAPQMGVMPKIASPVSRSPLARAASAVKGKAGSIKGGIPDALKTKEGLGFAGKALETGAGIIGSQAQAAQAQQQYDDQQQQLQARAEMMALFAPQMAGNLGMTNFMPQAANIGASGRGTPAMTMQNYIDSTGANATEEEFGPEMMNYINSRRGQPAGPSQGLMNYVNSRR
jgi:hypothetical protein